MNKRSARIANIAFLLLGLGLLIGVLLRMDMTEIGQQLLRIGPLFLAAFGCYVLAVLGSSAAWWSMTDPAASRARFHHFVAALWAGHAINTITPTASLGEVFKGTMMKGRIDGQELVASLISFNFLATLITQLFTMIAPLACLALLDLSSEVMWSLFGVACLFFLPVIGMLALLRFGAADKVVRLAGRLPFVRIKDPANLLAKAKAVDLRIQSFPRRRPGRFCLALALLVGVRLMQVAEVWVLLLALMPDKSPTWILLLALVTQTASQLIAWVMTFVPSQIGVAESGSALLFQLLHLDPLLGLSMEVARRLRKLIGTAIGLLIGWWGMRASHSLRN
ncbi:MAG: flippase-like domain-containing protein [Deltaproteobacteria bacterium]|nr:flippase-like domain-containing protein [Deltaproteobacteria bacterium]